MKAIVGLGNPGRRYERTRHNVGFQAVDALAEEAGARFRRSLRVPAALARATVAGREVVLVKPLTYMNESGRAVGPLLRRQGLSAADLVVVLDDADLECGRLRIRRKGSSGGHHGLQSVIEAVGSCEFARVRIGVGPRPPGEELVAYVLSGFRPEERERVSVAVGRAAEALAWLAGDRLEEAMNAFNAE